MDFGKRLDRQNNVAQIKLMGLSSIEQVASLPPDLQQHPNRHLQSTWHLHLYKLFDKRPQNRVGRWPKQQQPADGLQNPDVPGDGGCGNQRALRYKGNHAYFLR